MKKRIALKEKGISLRKLNIIMLLVAIALSGILMGAMYGTNQVYQKAHELTRNLVDWRTESYGMQIASDYLTEQIRSFAVTGDRQYLQNYFEEADFTKRREKALQSLQRISVDTQADEELQLAMDGSLKLMEVEYYAARLAIAAYGYDPEEFPVQIRETKLTEADAALSAERMLEKARGILFDADYHGQKEEISRHMAACLQQIAEVLDEEQKNASARLKRQVIWEHFLTGVLIVILLLMVQLTSKLVFGPLQKAVERIRDEKDISPEGAYEIRFLAKTYNLMHQTNLERREKLTYEATHDKLTGLYNRRGYDFLLKNVDLDTSALLLIDLDEFKGINDTYGHDVGDKVLTKVANAIRNSFRSQDYVCRIGGDEFAVIMIHADEEQTDLIRGKIWKINEYLQKKEEGVPAISISAGVTFGEDGHIAEIVFKEADEALYLAKNEGKKGISFHHELKE